MSGQFSPQTPEEADAYYQGQQDMKKACMDNLQDWVNAIRRENPNSVSACNFAAARVVVELTVGPTLTSRGK